MGAGAVLILAVGLDAAPVTVPTYAPVPGPVQWQVVVTNREGDVLGAFRDAIPERVTDTLDGVGEHVFTWSPRVEEEPGAGLLIDGGRPVTWADADVEVALYRSGALAAVGPVVSHDWTPDGRIRTTCWSREAYLAALCVGDAERVNLFPAGDWSNGFGWQEAGEVAASLVVHDEIWRTDEVLQLAQGGSDDGRVTDRLTINGVNASNRIFVSIPVRWDSGTGWGGGSAIVARITHWTTDSAGRKTPRGSRVLTLDPGSAAGPWYKLEESLPEHAGLKNEYAIALYAPPGQDDAGYVGEVQIVRNENVSARAGWDKATLIAALFDDARTRLPGGPSKWNRDVDPTGEPLSFAVKYQDSDHPDMVSVLRDWSELGTWWVPLGTRVLKWAPQRGSGEPVAVVTRDNAADLRLTVDGSECSTDVITLADGQTGPTREEGAADLGTDLRLTSVHNAPLGMQPRSLDEHALHVLSELVAPAVRVSAVATGLRFPGDYWHKTQPGDLVRVRVRDGLLDLTADAVIAARSLDCRTDQVTPTFTETV